MTGTDTRAATEDDLKPGEIQRLIEGLEEAVRSKIREAQAEAIWVRRMQDQTANHLDVLVQMKATLDAIQSWIGA